MDQGVSQKPKIKKKINHCHPHTEPLGGDPDPSCLHLTVDPPWQCLGWTSATRSPCLLPLEGKDCFPVSVSHGGHGWGTQRSEQRDMPVLGS